MIGRLAVSGLALSRGGRGLFRGLSFTVAAGEAVALVGANGAGKTSALRAVAGLLRPDAGEVAFQGEGGVGVDPEDARSAGLHLLGHHDGLKTTRTAREELAFWTAWSGGDPAPAVEAMGLEPLLDLEVRKLSAGQRRRLSLARLVASPRPLWLLDEPLAPLDARNRDRVGALMTAHLERGGLILAAVHDPLPAPHRVVEIGA